MSESKQELVKTEETAPVRKPERNGTAHIAPRYEVVEREQGYTVRLEMPGVGKEGLEIQADHETLTVRGRRNEASEGLTALYVERPWAEYFREFSMDDTVDWEKIAASVRDGIVSIDIPKASHARPRRIEVS